MMDGVYCSQSFPSPLLFLADILNFCANNYLGLSSHPEVIRSGLNTLEKYGAGLSSVRFICGTQVGRTPEPQGVAIASSPIYKD